MNRNNVFVRLKNLRRKIFSILIGFWKFLPGYVVYIVLGLVLALLIWFLLFKTNIFLISEVKTNDLKWVEDTKISQVTNKYIGERIFEVDPDKIEEEIAKQSVYIKTVNVEKKLPTGLNVEITEREPVFLLVKDGISPKLLIDKEQFVLEAYKPTETPMTGILPVNLNMILLDELPKKPGTSVNIEGLDFIISSRKNFDGSNAEISAAKLYTLTDSRVEVELTTGTKVLLDYNQGVKTQVDRLLVILADTKMKNKQLVYVDVSLEKPYGKYK